MPTSTTVRAPITPLTPAQHRAAQQLVDGLSTLEIAARNGLSIETVRNYIREIRRSLHCPPRCKPHVLAHFLLTSQQVTPPTAQRPRPALDQRQTVLLTAVAEHSGRPAISRAAGITPASVQPSLDDLLRTTGADNVTQLVVLGHAWGLLGTEQAATAQSGADR